MPNSLDSLTELDDHYMSRAQVAHLLNVSPSTITRWAEEGKLTPVRTLGGHRRYAAAAILELVRTFTKEKRMETLSTEIPRMYADHHVSAVRELLSALNGIHDVKASAATRQLFVEFDPGLTTADTILASLADGDYPALYSHRRAEEARGHRDPGWDVLELRMTETHPADR